MTLGTADILSSRRDKIFFAVNWLFFMALCGLAALVVCAALAQNVEDDILNEEKQRQLAWLRHCQDGTRALTEKINRQMTDLARSPAFVNFLEDSGFGDAARYLNPDYLRGNGEPARAKNAQLRKIAAQLEDFVKNPPCVYAKLLDKSQNSLLGAGQKFSPDEQLLRRSLQSGKTEFGALRFLDNIPVLDAAMPLYPGKRDMEPRACLYVGLSLAQFIPSLLDGQDSRLEKFLVFPDGDSFGILSEEGGKAAIFPLGANYMGFDDAGFAERAMPTGKGMGYSTAQVMENPPWLFLAAMPATAIEAAARPRWLRIYAIGALLALLFSFISAWIWHRWEQRKWFGTINRMQALSARVDNQNALLDSINSTLGIGLLVLDARDNALLANRAFLEICGRKELPKNAPLDSLLPHDLAASISKDIRIVKDAGHSGSMEVELPGPGNEKHVYRITLYPARRGARQDEGVVIFQDITQFRKNAKNSRERQLALISALGTAIESVDQNLTGHSEKLEKLSELLANAMRLEENERETLRLASRLSQVGKLFVPRDLLTRKGPLSPQELAEVRRAPQYADKVLAHMHFDLPVRETATMLGERLNGSGPRGMLGEEITISGRILAVANAFISMTSPRAWREGKVMSIEEAFAHLRADEGFDQHIVNTLASLSPALIHAALLPPANRDNFAS